jgi:phage I-like protein
MAFDPTFPADHSELDGGPYRDQFNALKALIDAQQAQISDLQSNLNDLSLQGGDNAAAITALQAAVAALQGNS